MSSVWNGSLSFGLLSIPVKASVAARAESISFNLLHSECGSRITTKSWCPSCNKEIARSETGKGYEIADGHFLRVSKEELDACAPESGKVMELDAIVNAAEVDPLLFESSYYLEPDKAGRKGYKLLYDALKADNKMAIGHITLSHREHVAILRPYRHALVFHTMFYADELRAVPSAADLSDVKSVPAELALARQLLEANAQPFDLKEYSDGYRTRIQALLDAKQADKPAPTAVPKKAPAAQPDIMAALAASLKAGKKKAA